MTKAASGFILADIGYGFHVKLDCSKTGAGGRLCPLAAVVFNSFCS